MRITTGDLFDKSRDSLSFGGCVSLAGEDIEWSVRISLPADGQSGFTVRTTLVPRHEAIEVLEALSTFETPYEYDENAQSMYCLCQQPVYRFAGAKTLNDAGWMQPIWYYGRHGRAHLTYQSASPLLTHRLCDADGGNVRHILILGNWHICSVKDMFSQPTRWLNKGEKEVFPDDRLRSAEKRRGAKYLVGAVNWNNSLIKDPNVLVEPGSGLQQEVIVDFAGRMPGGTWDEWLAGAWERLAQMHFPADGQVPAYMVAKARGASWVAAAEWLAEQISKPDGCPGFFYPKRGTCVYAPNTRPKWDKGVPIFAGQFAGPLAYLGHVWKDEEISEAADRLERIFLQDKNHPPEQIWTIGPTPFFVAVMRKWQIAGVLPATRAKIEDYIRRRTDYVLNPPPNSKRGDGGIFAWDAYANLIAAELFDTARREQAAKALLAEVNRRLDGEFWTFNCSAEGDLVGAGNARPFGHGVACHANILAWRRFSDRCYLEAAQRFANLLLGMHMIAWNESPSPDLDTRGWCHGSTGGRDQIAQLPPWESGYSLQQFAPLILAGQGRPGIYDALWLYSHTGLAQYPKARTMKRIYTPDMRIVYRPIESLATERAFYLSLPYLAYENPWDQTMLAGYQGVEGIILSLMLGGGIVASEDERVMALVPEAAVYMPQLAQAFTVELWNPLRKTVVTRLRFTIAERRREAYRYSGPSRGEVSAREPFSRPVSIPPRRVLQLQVQRA